MTLALPPEEDPLRELLAVATSEANGAAYSAGMHAALLEELGGGSDATPRDRALVAFARRLRLTSGLTAMPLT